MPKRNRPCLTCHRLTKAGPRCQHCAPHGKRDYRDERKRTTLLANWRYQVGPFCPGTPWCNTPDVPHHTDDLTVDHTTPQARGGTLESGYTIMCRPANSRKHAT